MLTATYLDSSVPRTWDATKRCGCNRPVYRGWWKWAQKRSKERTIPIWKLPGMPLFPFAQFFPFLLHCRTHQLDTQCTFHNHNQRTTNLCPLIQPPVVAPFVLILFLERTLAEFILMIDKAQANPILHCRRSNPVDSCAI